MKKTTTAILTALALIAIAPSANAQIASKQYVDDQDSAILNGTASAAEKAEIYENTDIDSSAVQDVSDAVSAIGVNGVVTVVAEQIGSVRNTVGNSNSGLVKDVADLENTVGDANSGLVKDVADLEDATDTIVNALRNRASSVAYAQSGEGFLYVKDGYTKKLTAVVDSVVAKNANIQLGKLAFPTPPTACETAGCMLMYVNGQYTWELVSRETNETPTVTAANAVSATASTGVTASSNPFGYGADTVGWSLVCTKDSQCGGGGTVCDNGYCTQQEI